MAVVKVAHCRNKTDGLPLDSVPRKTVSKPTDCVKYLHCYPFKALRLVLSEIINSKVFKTSIFTHKHKATGANRTITLFA